MLKFLFFLVLIGAGVGTYLIQTGQLDPQQVKMVVENVDDYVKAAVNSVDDAQKAVDKVNARNANLQQEIENAKK